MILFIYYHYSTTKRLYLNISLAVYIDLVDVYNLIYLSHFNFFIFP